MAIVAGILKRKALADLANGVRRFGPRLIHRPWRCKSMGPRCTASGRRHVAMCLAAGYVIAFGAGLICRALDEVAHRSDRISLCHNWSIGTGSQEAIPQKTRKTS